MSKKKDKKWIQKASASIKKRGTKGVCTGPKFGGPSCPPGSRRYNLAKVFRGMARKRKNAAEGAMIKANTGQLVRERTRGTGAAVTGDTHVVMKGMDAAQTGKLIQVPTRGSGAAVTGNQHYVMEGMDAAKHGKIIKAKTGVSAPVYPGVKTGTSYTSPGWINRNLNKIKDMMKVGTKTTAMSAGAINPSKWTSKIPKPSQLKTLMKAGGKRSVALAGGPIGLGMYAGTMGAKAAVTHAFKGYKKDGKWTKEGYKKLESEARKREALLKKRNKARGYKGGAEIIAPDYMHVIRPKPTSGGTVLEQKPLNDYTKDLI